MIPKFKTGIKGFDELTSGGLPLNRSTLIAGGAGCGKTLFLTTVLAKGVLAKGEPAVFISLGERTEDVIANAMTVGIDLNEYISDDLLVLEQIESDQDHTTESGSYNLDGLKLRIDLALTRHGAKFLALDTIESLFTLFGNERTVRLELMKLLQWLSGKGITCLITGEKGSVRLTRRGLEEYVSDCVIALENDTAGDVATRRLRVMKYRGSEHGVNLYPFLVDHDGITVMPLSSAGLEHDVSGDRFQTGTSVLDDALEGGLRVGSTTLISGGTGVGKTIIAALMAEAACDRGERVVYYSFEESPKELVWNVDSTGIHLGEHHKSGLLQIHSARPTSYGLERHLVELYKMVESHNPTLVVIDPISSLKSAGAENDVYRATVLMIDFLKSSGITSVLTMEGKNENVKYAEVNFSSILDVWLHMDSNSVESGKGIERFIKIMKARGIDHDHRDIGFGISKGSIELESPDE